MLVAKPSPMNLAKLFSGFLFVVACAPLFAQPAPPSTRAGIRCLEPDAVTGTSTAVIVDDAPLVHTAQLLPLNQKGELAGNGEAAKQAEQVLANLALVLGGAKSDLTNTIKLN